MSSRKENFPEWAWHPFLWVMFLMFMATLLPGCSPQIRNVVVKQELPTVNIAPEARQANWSGWNGRGYEGSCVHATLVSLLRWQGHDELASFWRRTNSAGENPYSFAARLSSENILFAQTENGDVAFLEWACQTRRGAGITVMGGKHMVALVHFGPVWAAILDNNDTSRFIWILRSRLIAEWKASNGWAVSPVYSPAAPLPTFP